MTNTPEQRPERVDPPTLADALRPKARPQQERVFSEQRSYTLITPLFGGGVEAGVVDPLTPIRGSEVRGQLRFWWRAMQDYSDIEVLRKAEGALWGSASDNTKGSRSQVIVRISAVTQGRAEAPYRESDRGRPVARREVAPPYAAFPLQPSSDEMRLGNPTFKEVMLGITFTLEIRYPAAFAADVQRALWAWETFGGLGARTRRGFGALRLDRITRDGADVPIDRPPADPAGAQAWVRERLDDIAQSEIKGLPHLGGATVVVAGKPGGGQPFAEAKDAWDHLIGRLSQFRQSRNPGSPTPGRSHWPEPDVIRRVTGRASRHHQPQHVAHKVPRARFGLPIITQFRDKREGDPDNISMELKGPGRGQTIDRLASPLILRPLACGDGTRFVALALVLRGSELDDDGFIQGHPIVIKGYGAQLSAALTSTEAQAIQPLKGKTDVLEAFLTTL